MKPVLFLFIALALVACGSSGGGYTPASSVTKPTPTPKPTARPTASPTPEPTPTASPTPGVLTLSPSTTYMGPNSTAQLAVSEPYYQNGFTQSNNCSNASVSPNHMSGPSALITVKTAAKFTFPCWVAVVDGFGHRVQVAIDLPTPSPSPTP